MPFSPFNWDKAGIDVQKVQNNKTFCPKCHSQRTNKRDKSLYVNLQTGVYRCFYSSCDFRGCVADKPQYFKKREFSEPPARLQKISTELIEWFESRMISNITLLRMKITESIEHFGGEKKKAICYNYFRDEKLINIKFRTRDKLFKMVANAELIPYNVDAAKNETDLIWVEGENDCLAVIESNVFNVVSVPNGAGGADAKLEYIDNCWQDIEHIERHIIAVDGDKAGEKLKEALAFRFGIEKCWFIKYPEDKVVNDNEELRACKDLNEVLISFGKEKVKEVLEKAEQPPLVGVYYTKDLADEIFERYYNEKVVGETTHYPEFDKIFKWKRREVNLWFGYGNYGKTQVFLDKALVKSMYDDWRWAVFCPENFPATDFYIDLMEMFIAKHIDDRMGNKMTADEVSQAIDFLHEHFIYVYPDEVQDLSTIHTLFRSLILRHGIDGVLIDPWNQLDHIIDNREDLYLSKALKEVKKFSLLNNISYNIIAHPKTINADRDGNLPEAQVWHIAGGQMFRNKIDNILSVERPAWQDKTSGWTRIKTHKIKRRRTGGMPNAEADFDYILKESRYAEKDSGLVVCDRKRAAAYRQNNSIQIKLIDWEQDEKPQSPEDDLGNPDYVPF